MPRRAWWRRPQGLVEQTRWLFCVCAVSSLVVALPGPLATATSVDLALLALFTAALVGSWVYRYRSRSGPLVLDVVDAVVVTGFCLVSPTPAVTFGLVIAALWFRAVYGSTRQVVLAAVLLAAGVSVSVPLWGVIPGHGTSTPAAPVVSIVPLVFTTLAVARHLAFGLFTRERGQRRDTVLTELGSRLLTLVDGAAIHAAAWDAAAGICAATPGLRLVVVQEDGAELAVVGSCGEVGRLPETLPRALVGGPAAPGGPWRPVGAAPLAAASGSAGGWLVSLVPQRVDRWAFVGGPSRRVAEATPAIDQMFNQVALALQRSSTHQDLTTQARTDGLTGLANRDAFVAALDAGLADPDTAVTVLFLDLDDFKVVNDGFGHASGDELLRQVASRLHREVRAGDLCARLGGDEFAVLLRDGGHHDDPDVARSIAERLVETVACPFTLMGRVARIGVSVGLAPASADTTAEEVVRRADIAMYAAKATGKNRLQLFSASLLPADAQSVFESELAAAADAGQLVVHYQPITSAADGRCVAVEALVRWQHPTRGLVPPLDFVETAERTGAISGIGEFVLRQACADAARWDDGVGGRLRVHVNVSAAQLVDPTFVDTVRRCVADRGMARGHLVLEITESMVARSAAVRATLDSVVAAGVAIAIDDFGTGYSSLTTLRTLPLDVVKIDRSFVAGCPADPADRTVVEAIVQMASGLGLSTVAEGVERPEQEAFLRGIGTDAVQGFLHARPAPAAEFARWLDAQPTRHPGPVAANVVALAPRRAG